MDRIGRIPNLDFLRFFAASLVICQHIEFYAASFLYKPEEYSLLSVSGGSGVLLFFVLSGFLITTLLLAEKANASTLSFKGFYRKRVLRIWPLYLLVVFLGFFVFPLLPFFTPDFKNGSLVEVSGERFFPNVLYYLFGTPQMGRMLYGNVPFISQTWTLATELVFYLMWPFVIEYFSKRLLGVMVAIILIYNGILYFLVTGYGSIIPYHRFIISFLTDIKITGMVIGAMFAVIVRRDTPILKLMFSPVVFLICSVLSLVVVIKGAADIYSNPIYAVLFGIIISNVGFNRRFEKLLENKVTNYLGTISYGMYMYHCIAIVIGMRLSFYFNSVWTIYAVTFLTTILISHLSYRYFESYFMRFRTRPTPLSA